jgi:hypothetical protein
MNKIAATIAAGVGGTFLVLGMMFPHQVQLIASGSIMDVLWPSNEAKARFAVQAILVDPPSAQFHAVHSVQASSATYVCGNVNSRDRSGVYVGHRAFVYDVASQFVRIDDDGRIARIRVATFAPCPDANEPAPSSPELKISPQALEMAGKVIKVMPKIDPQAVMSLAGPMADAGAGGDPSLKGQLQVLAASTPQVGKSSEGQSGAFTKPSPPKPVLTVSLESEREWRADRVPAAWPVFPAGDPLAKPADKRSAADTLALATEIEERWTKFKAGQTKARPAVTETREALRALLAIEPASEAFSQAWGLFVRLRQIDRDASLKAASR